MNWAKGAPPTLREWHAGMVFSNTQSDVFAELVPLRNHPKDIWSPYQAHLVCVAAEDASFITLTGVSAVLAILPMYLPAPAYCVILRGSCDWCCVMQYHIFHNTDFIAKVNHCSPVFHHALICCTLLACLLLSPCSGWVQNAGI